jgi:RNA polymerase-binding protein DksA
MNTDPGDLPMDKNSTPHPAARALTHGQHSWLQAELEQRRTALSEQLAAHLHGQTRAEQAHDRLTQDGDDAPQRAPEMAMAAALTDREQRELAEVTAALKRLADNAYGRCTDCDAEIPFDRLQVEPWATRCVPCEEQRESRRR